jgi:predicted ArsR family transcriptional regulator
MAIVQTLTRSEFADAFLSLRPDNFSYAGLDALFDYLEEYSDSTGEPFELDVIAICCDFSESTWQEIANDYRIDLEGCDDDDERYQTVLQYLQDNTVVIELGDDETMIYQSF